MGIFYACRKISRLLCSDFISCNTSIYEPGAQYSYKIIYTLHIGVDKSGYQVSFFLISPRKHML